MSIVAFDLGNANCYIAVARAGGIETVANEYSDRCTPAIVAFNDLHRLVGVSAKNQMIMNIESTVSQFKRLIGRKYDEPAVQEEIKRQPFAIIKTDDGNIGIKLNFKDEEQVFSPEQVMAMLLTELKNTAQINLNTKVVDCVISVPSFYTDYQRKALLTSAQIAGLNCLKIMNDTSAIALNYGLFKQDVPAVGEKSLHVAFVDFGHSSFQVCIAAFNKGKIKILSSANDPNVGGRDFDSRLQHYFAEKFLTRYKIDATKNKKAWLRLGTEVEKIKKQMSSNSTDLPLNIECFMDDKDVSCKINRAQFEELCQDLISGIAIPVKQALEESGLKHEEINVIELVGGSSRIPAVKAVIESVFQKPISTTLNQDEAVARGCSIQCAMLSHTVKVRDIEVMDAASYPVNISWDSKNADELGEMEVFKKHHAYPFTKMLTFPHRVEPFQFRVFYRDNVPVPHFQKEIGQYTVNAAAPSQSDDVSKVKVKVKVRFDIHGCFTVSSASMVETLPPPPPTLEKVEPMETEAANGEAEKPKENTDAEIRQEETEKMEEGNANPDENMKPEENAKPDENGITQEKSEKENADIKSKNKESKKEEGKKPEAKKPKKLTKCTELEVKKVEYGFTPAQLNLLVEIENELIAQVHLEKERADAKNAVEEYVYGMRSKIHDIYEKNITEEDRGMFSSLLSDTEDWLYDDGENQPKQVYIDKLAELKKIGQPVVDRHNAHAKLPSAFESLGSALTHYRKILELYADKDEKYAHLEEAEVKKVQKQCKDKFKWFNEKMQANGKCPPHLTPSVYPSQVFTEKKLLEDFCNPIVNKSKPKVEPPKAEVPKKDNTETPKQTSQEKPAENMETSQKEEAAKSNLDMEVD